MKKEKTRRDITKASRWRVSTCIKAGYEYRRQPIASISRSTNCSDKHFFLQLTYEENFYLMLRRFFFINFQNVATESGGERK